MIKRGLLGLGAVPFVALAESSQQVSGGMNRELGAGAVWSYVVTYGGNGEWSFLKRYRATAREAAGTITIEAWDDAYGVVERIVGRVRGDRFRGRWINLASEPNEAEVEGFFVSETEGRRHTEVYTLACPYFLIGVSRLTMLPPR